MRALITGHAGFLGRHFKIELERRGYKILGIDPEAPWTWGTFNDAMRTFTSYAIREKFDLIVHCAARAPHRAAIDMNPGAAAYNQLLDTAMFNWAIETRQSRVLYVSSSAVYSDDVRDSSLGGNLMENYRGGKGFTEAMGFLHDPFDAYGETKRAGERLADIANRCGVQTTVVRPFSGYGSDQSSDFPFGAFIRRAMNFEEPFKIWGNADQRRDFVHVDDIVNGALALVDQGVTQPVNICTGIGTSMAELAYMIIDEMSHMSYHPQIEVDEAAPMGVMYRVGDPTLLRKYYTPRWGLRDGIVQALEAHRA